MKFATLIRFLHHWFAASSRYRVHSPFAYTFCTQVLPHQSSEQGKKIEAFRKTLCRSHQRISFKDLGAGSLGKTTMVRESTVGKLAQRAARRYREGELLYRICKHYQPQRCLEFGTNLGISTLYQITALTHSQFITMEGSPELADIAATHFKLWKIAPRQEVGDFSDLLQTSINLAAFQPDYVFIDGNHRYQPTLDYFHQLLPHMAPGGIIIFDDINWSAEMQRAWREIVRHPKVSLSIDLFFMGICFIRRPQAKEHFAFRFR